MSMTTTSTITSVRTIGVAVSDQEAALGFYLDTVGFDLVMDASIGDGMRWIEVAPADARVSLALTQGERSAQEIDTGIRFTVPDASAERAEMAARGVAVGDLIQWEGVPAMFTFEDPDRNLFYVVEDRP
jgi:predicted enzyme related to lactoylglutathione lyase